MGHKRWVTLDPKERQEVIEGILQKLAPQVQESVNHFLTSIEPQVREIARSEVGKFAVTEKQADAFLSGMIQTAAEKAAEYFRPRWIMKIFFKGRFKK